MNNSAVLDGCDGGVVCGYCGWALDAGGDFCRATGDTHTLAVCRNELARQLRDARRVVPVCFDCLRPVPTHATWCPQGRRTSEAWHWMPSPGIAACCADYRSMRKTEIVAHVTCTACRRKTEQRSGDASEAPPEYTGTVDGSRFPVDMTGAPRSGEAR